VVVVVVHLPLTTTWPSELSTITSAADAGVANGALPSSNASPSPVVTADRAIEAPIIV
jgi:hypothetical protein